MKKIYLKPKSGFPYQDTDVSFEKSIEDIKKLLRKFECEGIATYEDKDTVKIAFKKGGVAYLIEFPQIFIEGKLTPAHSAMRISGRIVYNELKSMLISVEIGAQDFMQAMLRYIALPSPQGLTTLGDVVEAQKDRLTKGQQIELDPSKVKLLTGEVK